MLDRWAKRMMRAPKTDVIASPSMMNDLEINITENKVMENCVKDHEKIMAYLQKENTCGHAHNLDMLIASVNLNQHLREAVLFSQVKEVDNYYSISFPFGVKIIEFKISKKAIENE